MPNQGRFFNFAEFFDRCFVVAGANAIESCRFEFPDLIALRWSERVPYTSQSNLEIQDELDAPRFAIAIRRYVYIRRRTK
jgi:hypothetical protein